MVKKLNFIQRAVAKTLLSQMTLQDWINSTVPHRSLGNNTPQLYVSNSADIMAKNAWVFSSIRAITNKVTSIPFHIVDKGNKDSTRAMDYFLLKANNEYTFVELMMQVQSWCELRGFAILYKQPDGTLDVLDSDKVSAKWMTDGSYQLWYNSNNKYTQLDKENYCKVRNFCPFATSTGFTALQPAAQMINIEYAVMNTTQTGFDNGASFNGALTTDQQIHKEKVEEIAKFWAEGHSGTQNAGKIPVLHSGYHLEKIGLSPADYDLLKYVAVSKNLISTVIGVPGIIINDMEHADYANAKKQEEIFARNTIVPKILQREATFDQFLLPLMGFGGLHWDYNWEELPELQEDQLTKSQSQKTFIEAGLRSPNELRKKDGLEDYEGGDSYVQTGNLFPVGQPRPTPLAAKMGELLKAISNKTNKSDRKDKIYELFIKRMDPQWKKFTKEMNDYFKKQYKGIISNATEQASRLAKLATQKAFDDVDDIVDDEIMDAGYIETLRKLSHRYYTAYVSQAGDATVAEYRLGIAFDMQSKEVLDFIKNSTIKLSKEVYGTTRDQVSERIKSILADSMEKMLSQKEIEELIIKGMEDLFEITPARAELIARTETAKANNQGAIEAARQGDMKLKRWNHGGGGAHVREEHVAIDGETVGIDEDFSLGFGSPGEGDAGDSCNCTCFLTFAYAPEEF